MWYGTNMFEMAHMETLNSRGTEQETEEAKRFLSKVSLEAEARYAEFYKQNEHLLFT